MKTRGSSPFIAGDLSLADLYLAPLVFYPKLADSASPATIFRTTWLRKRLISLVRGGAARPKTAVVPTKGISSGFDL
jgi:glutathione S-transferase